MASGDDLSSQLLDAAKHGDKDCCQLLLDRGADVNGRDDGVSGLLTCIFFIFELLFFMCFFMYSIGF
jgi:hypothetical protein